MKQVWPDYLEELKEPRDVWHQNPDNTITNISTGEVKDAGGSPFKDLMTPEWKEYVDNWKKKKKDKPHSDLTKSFEKGEFQWDPGGGDIGQQWLNQKRDLSDPVNKAIQKQLISRGLLSKDGKKAIGLTASGKLPFKYGGLIR